MRRCPEFPNKRRFPTYRDAETATIIMASEHDIEFEIYHCDACKGWHLTSKIDFDSNIKI